MFDDIKRTRNTDWINNFWRALANHPPTLRRTWESLKEVMAPGALDPADQGTDLSRGEHHELLRILHRLARRRGKEARHVRSRCSAEFVAVVGMANETNALANGYRVPVDERFENLF